MNTTIRVRAMAPTTWGTGADSIAAGEVVARPGSGPGRMPRKAFSLGINSGPQQIAVAPGDYTVRLFLPSGEILAESVSLSPGEQEEVVFELRASPHEWLGADAVMGNVQRLPNAERARGLESVRSAPETLLDGIAGNRPTERALSNMRYLAAQAVSDTDRNIAAVASISGLERVPKIVGWRWLTRIRRDRPLPGGRLPLLDVVRWWTGDPESPPTPLHITHHDEHNARLATSPATRVASFEYIAGDRRAFAAVEDPTGNLYYAVLPEGWARTSRAAYGDQAPASVLMTVAVDSVLLAGDEAGSGAHWRCSPSVDDLQAMAVMGFLASGQTHAAEILLQQAQDLLFDKTINPVAAVAGAYALLAYSEETNARERPQWRNWIRNLCNFFPGFPDGAIAMAKLYLKFGEGAVEEEIDAERLRAYALDAVRRGLPYLSFGINILSEILLLLVRDDEAGKRSGPAIEDTRRAYALVHQLTRIMAPGEFFTVLRLGETRL